MKKLFILIAVLTLTFTLTGCGGETELPDEMTMAELDEFLGREDVQYVDLRNFDEKLISGYIQGFESIPYFDYLKYNGILNDANSDWTFDDGEVLSAATMRAMFNEDKTILLMCGSGTRAQYVMDALLSLGYEDVINIGGYAAYDEADGEAIVLGGSPWVLDVHVKGDYTPGTYFGSTDALYTAVVVINPEGGIQSLFFDAVTCDTDTDADDIKDSDCTTKQVKGDAYNMVTYGGAGQEWYMQANELAAAIVAAQGWSASWTIVEDHFDGVDDVAGVTISVDGFQGALEDALAQATD